MHRLISSLMAAVLLAHALLGCCWHHAHACVMESEEPSVCAAHRDDSHGAPDGSDEHDGHQHECGGGTCVFVRIENSPIGQLLTSWAIDLAFSTSPSQFTGESVHWAVSADPQEFAGPVRLHLLHQLLLI